MSVMEVLRTVHVSPKLTFPIANQGRQPRDVRHAWAGVSLELV